MLQYTLWVQAPGHFVEKQGRETEKVLTWMFLFFNLEPTRTGYDMIFRRT